MKGYVKWFHETIYMCLLINYNRICNKVSNLMKKGFTSEPVYNEKYSKTKIKSCHGSKKNISFNDNGIPTEGSHCVCLSVILIDFHFKVSKNYYPQSFLD